MATSPTPTCLFHVSRCQRDLGPQPLLGIRTWPDPEREAIECALDAQRPAGAPSRRKSYFAFNTIEECGLYAESEKIETPHYYRVQLLDPVRAPITLEYVSGDLEPYRDAIYRHYWNADGGWKVYEYFSPKMIVVSEYREPLPDPGPVRFKLSEDRNRLRKLREAWA